MPPFCCNIVIIEILSFQFLCARKLSPALQVLCPTIVCDFENRGGFGCPQMEVYGLTLHHNIKRVPCEKESSSHIKNPCVHDLAPLAAASPSDHLKVLVAFSRAHVRYEPKLSPHSSLNGCLLHSPGFPLMTPIQYGGLIVRAQYLALARQKIAYCAG